MWKSHRFANQRLRYTQLRISHTSNTNTKSTLQQPYSSSATILPRRIEIVLVLRAHTSHAVSYGGIFSEEETLIVLADKVSFLLSR